MIQLAIVVTAMVLGFAWELWLEWRYGAQVSPDASITVGFALLGGWFLLAVLALVALLVAS